MEQNLDLHIEKSLPSVKKYSNIYKYIEDVFQYKKRLDPKFTLDLWSLELGFKSRSFAFMVFHQQKPITSNFVHALVTNLKLNEKEQEHLFLLFDYAKSKKASQRKFYLNQILENLEGNWVNVESKHQSEFLSSQEMMLIKLLLAFEDFVGTETEIASLLGMKKTELKVKLKRLHEMDMVMPLAVESQKEVIWKAKNKSFDIPEGLKDEAVNLFHQNTATETLDVLQKNEALRKFRTIFFSLPEEDFADLTEEIEAFSNRLRNKYGNDFLTNKRLIKVNVQAYPVTQKLKTKA